MQRSHRVSRLRASRRGRIPPQIVRAPRRVGSGFVRLLSGFLLILLLMSTVILGSSAATAYSAYSQLASSLNPRLNQLSQAADGFQTTRVYDRNGRQLYEFFGAGKRTRAALADISPDLINATISIEDKTFFENTGVDYEGIAKAFYRSLSAGEETGGASTITQQLIKLLLLTDEEREYENRYQRKIAEIILAQELSEKRSKKEILEIYLNEIYYGNLAYGIEAASNVYFDRSAKELTLAQAALLAGLPQLPNVYDPFANAEGNVIRGFRLGENWLSPEYRLPDGIPPPKWRQIAVLRQMVDEGYITEAQARRASLDDLKLSTREIPLYAPHFVFYIRQLLEERYGPQFANMGLSVYTSIDLDLQNMVQQQAADRITELEERNIHNAAVVVLQPNTGQILAMVGSIDYNRVTPSKTRGQSKNVLDGQVNVTTQLRQPGSALKPFTYLSAMEQGMTPASVLWDVPTKFPLGGGKWYEPKNYNGRWNGPVRMRTALANSLNMPAVKALKFAGIDHTLGLLKRAGINSLTQGANFYGLSLTLGGGEVSPLELTAAYNTLASGGKYYAPVGILKIQDANGKVLDEYRVAEKKPTIDPELVGIITDMLSDDKAREPVWGLDSKLKLSLPAAVKTGTSNDWRDAWAVGFTPFVTVGVWTGNNNNEETAKVESITGGGAIWHNVMEEMFKNPHFVSLLAEPYNGTLPRAFSLPETLKRNQICELSGPFNNYKQDLFASTMTARNKVTEKQPTTLSDGCSLQTKISVLAYDDGDKKSYCQPEPGSVPADLLTTVTVWKLPKPDPSERIEYRWEKSGPVSGGNVGPCSPEVIAQVTQSSQDGFGQGAEDGSARMPNLQGLGENQAKDLLATYGIYNVYVDYQSRDRIPDIFDSVAPYAVVSSQPGAGELIHPGMTVVLGVRAPE